MQLPPIPGISQPFVNGIPAVAGNNSLPQSAPVPKANGNDQFIPIVTSGVISPTGHPNSMFPISLAPDGSVIANTVTGKQKVAQLGTDGNYQLLNGQKGNIFQDEGLKVSYEYGDHPFLTALRATERRRAIAGSEIPLLRNRMNQMGLTGSGVKIAIIDPYEKEEKDKHEDENTYSALPPLPSPAEIVPFLAGSVPSNANNPQAGWKVSPHSEAVQTVMNDAVWGVAPGATVLQLPAAPSDSLDPKNDNLGELTNFLASDVCGVLNRGTGQLQAMMQLNDPTLRIASMTWGTTRALLYGTVLSILNEKDENQNYKYPMIRQGILGNSLYGSVQERFQAVARYIDQQVIPAPSVQQAYQRYVETTRQASLRGIIPVVSMANDRNLFKDAPEPPPGSSMNLLACSPYVIAVASSDTHQTPGYRQDDTISPFSSPGDGQQMNPTIAAPGQEIGIGRPYGPHGRNMVITGTSFSTPFTCGVIALMLEANPNLTFAQIKSMLQQSATPVAHSIAEEGAGVLNPEQAISQAMSSRTNPIVVPFSI